MHLLLVILIALSAYTLASAQEGCRSLNLKVSEEISLEVEEHQDDSALYVYVVRNLSKDKWLLVGREVYVYVYDCGVGVSVEGVGVSVYSALMPNEGKYVYVAPESERTGVARGKSEAELIKGLGPAAPKWAVVEYRHELPGAIVDTSRVLTAREILGDFKVITLY